jgi:hypothetical protein
MIVVTDSGLIPFSLFIASALIIVIIIIIIIIIIISAIGRNAGVTEGTGWC